MLLDPFDGEIKPILVRKKVITQNILPLPASKISAKLKDKIISKEAL